MIPHQPWLGGNNATKRTPTKTDKGGKRLVKKSTQPVRFSPRRKNINMSAATALNLLNSPSPSTSSQDIDSMESSANRTAQNPSKLQSMFEMSDILASTEKVLCQEEELWQISPVACPITELPSAPAKGSHLRRSNLFSPTTLTSSNDFTMLESTPVRTSQTGTGTDEKILRAIRTEIRAAEARIVERMDEKLDEVKVLINNTLTLTAAAPHKASRKSKAAKASRTRAEQEALNTMRGKVHDGVKEAATQDMNWHLGKKETASNAKNKPATDFVIQYVRSLLPDTAMTDLNNAITTYFTSRQAAHDRDRRGLKQKQLKQVKRTNRKNEKGERRRSALKAMTLPPDFKKKALRAFADYDLQSSDESASGSEIDEAGKKARVFASRKRAWESPALAELKGKLDAFDLKRANAQSKRQRLSRDWEGAPSTAPKPDNVAENDAWILLADDAE